MKATARLRELLISNKLLLAPGAYDGITARLVEQAGFPVVYMTGAGTAAAVAMVAPLQTGPARRNPEIRRAQPTAASRAATDTRWANHRESGTGARSG